MYSFRTNTNTSTSTGSVDLAFTDRYGGVSAMPFAELNLSVSGPDDEKTKKRNHRILMKDFAPDDRLADLYQVHGNDVVQATPGFRPEADGIVTDEAGITLMVRAADCVPVLLADPAAGVIGAAHAGRKGVQLGVVTATIERMRSLGAESITAWIGPHICKHCYEVGQAVQDEVAAVEPKTRFDRWVNSHALDLEAGVTAQLHRAGVTVDVSAVRCTLMEPDLYSFRRDGQDAGRLAGIIRMAPR